MSDKPIVHLICNAHIDPVWMWPWEEGAREAISTFRTAADLLDEFPEFVFNHNESLLYEWVEEYDPPLFERIQALVKAGRWNISGGWYLQPDCNLTGGETLVRCILEGRRYFAEKFGVQPPVAYNFDSFGHSNGLPQLLQQSGYEMYFHCRPSQTQLDIPASLYRWQGAAGAEVLGLRPLDVWYCTPSQETFGGVIECTDQARTGLAMAAATGQDVAIPWGLGDHGGGATRPDLEAFRELFAEVAGGPVEIRHSTPEAYLARVQAIEDVDPPVIEGDLQRVLAGCYTSVAPIKRKMRQGEVLLASAERWAALAWWRFGQAYPAAELRAAWKRLLFNTFHDILPGSLIEHALPGVHDMFGYSADVARRIIVNRQHAVLPNVKPTPDTVPVYVLNPHSAPMKSVVGSHFLRAYIGVRSPGAFALYDDHGRQVPHQERGGSAVREGTDMQPFIGFVADVPPLTARRYEIRFEDTPIPPAENLSAEVNDATITINNQWWAAMFDRSVGSLSELVEKASDQNVLQDHAQLWAMQDTAHAWGGMDRAIFNERIAPFTALTGEQIGQFVGEEADHSGQAVRVLHEGPVSITVECLVGWAYSRASIQYTFYADLPHIDVDVRLYMQARQKMIKFVLAFALPDVRAICEVPYGTAERTTDGAEHPYGRWLRLESDAITVGLANNGQTGFDVDATGVLGLNLSRGAVHSAWEDDSPLDPNRSYTFMDQEQIDTRFRLIAGTDAEQVATQLIPAALELNQTLEHFFVYHPPTAPENAPADPPPFLVVEPATVAIGAIKKADHADALVVRLVEMVGQATTAQISLDGGSTQTAAFKPNEIKTWLVTREGDAVIWRESDLLEA